MLFRSHVPEQREAPTVSESSMNNTPALRIRPAGPLVGTVALPGDKSISHRALLFSAIADGVSRIENFLVAGVTSAMMDCIQDLGAHIEIDR